MRKTSQDTTNEEKKRKNHSNNIHFVHFDGDTYFAPLKLNDVKLPSPSTHIDDSVEENWEQQQEQSSTQQETVRVEILDIRGDGVFDKLKDLGSQLNGVAFRDLNLQQLPKELVPIWQHIEQLDLSGNSLNDFSIAEIVPHLNKLTELNLNGNNIQQIPKNFKNLQLLKRIYIEYNKLATLHNVESKNLQWLVVDNNNLRSIDLFLRSSGSEKSLRVLDASHNEIGTVPPAIRNYRNLVHLNVSNNNLKLLPIELFKLNSLQFLNASFNQIAHVPSFNMSPTGGFAKSQLQSIDLSDNLLNKLPEHLLLMADSVDLSNNMIKFIRGNLLQKMAFKTPKELLIEGNPLSFPPAKRIGRDGLRGLLNFFSSIKGRVKKRHGIKVFVTGSSGSGKTSFVKSLVDEFPVS